MLGRASLPEAWDAGPHEPLPPECLMVRDELADADREAGGFFERAAHGLRHAPDLRELEARELLLLGRERGLVTRELGQLGSLPVDERKRRGRSLNVIKRALGELAGQRRQALEAAAEVHDALDVTLPGLTPWVGRAHVLAQVRDELLDLFHGLGYSQYVSPEVEWDAWNFGKLNFPPDHPARDAHDTYFVSPPPGVADGGPIVLRTHTSPGWVRAMEERKPPLRLVFPGRVFRAEQVDASHMDQFHQMDGLFVARDVSMADLKATLNLFARTLVGRDVKTRMIPIYFPFVEPGCQLDVACAACGGSGALPGGARCPVCKGSGWSELLGAGMVHPNVFRAVGYDPEEVTGFAFGIGLERTAMARLGISEIRLFLENDVRFLEQF